jgi:aconitate hydratase
VEINTTAELVSNVYLKLKENIVKYRSVVGKPLTLTEKILCGHFNKIDDTSFTGGKDYVFLKPDRVALQDVTGQMVMLQFMQAELKQTSLPTTVHCDHLIRAEVQGDVDMKAISFCKIWMWFLETRCWNNSSSSFRKLCISWWIDDWYGFSYS